MGGGNIISDVRFLIYVAGKMHWHNPEYSVWGDALSITFPGFRDELHKLERSYPVRFIFPCDRGFDHGGDPVKDIVSKDIRRVDMCDAIIAVFSAPNQIGTIVELMHAVHTGKHALVIFTSNVVRPSEKRKGDRIIEGARQILAPLVMRCESDHYWFLINYLLDEYSHYAQPFGPEPRFGDHVEIWIVYDATALPHIIAGWLRRFINRRGRELREWARRNMLSGDEEDARRLRELIRTALEKMPDPCHYCPLSEGDCPRDLCDAPYLFDETRRALMDALRIIDRMVSRRD